MRRCRRQPVRRRLERRGPRDLGLVRLIEEPSGMQRLPEDLLQPGRGMRDDLLRVREALAVQRQRVDRGIDLLGAVAALAHRAEPR